MKRVETAPRDNGEILREESLLRVEEAIKRIRNGEMVILVDDEDRENEGDLCMAAEKATPEAINFMARYGRGLICLTLTEEKADELNLPEMVQDNRSPFGTAFTVSIEARKGVSTGISASDRATTILTAVAKDTGPDDLVRPGHIFPLRARRGGVLIRTGQTEGSVDLARLAGLEPAGVICEVMNDDGTMARLPDLERYSEKHGIMILFVADLIQYRMKSERLVACRKRVVIPTAEWGEVEVRLYESRLDGHQHLAILKGLPQRRDRYSLTDGPTLVRVQTKCTLGSLMGSQGCPCNDKLRSALELITREGQGVTLYIDDGSTISEELEAHLGEPPADEDSSQGAILRNFGMGAQILADLGLHRIRLITNSPTKLVGLQGFGLEVVEQVFLDLPAPHSQPVIIPCPPQKGGALP